MVSFSGDSHILVLKKDGSVWAAGSNRVGQLGNGKGGPQMHGVPNPTFLKVMDSDVIAVEAGYYHSMLLKNDGSMWATGYNLEGT